MENQCEDIVDQILAQINEQEMCKLLNMDNSIDSTSSLRTSTTQTTRFPELTTDEQASFGSSKKFRSSKYMYFSGNSMGTKWKEWTKSRENSGAEYPFVYIRRSYRQTRRKRFLKCSIQWEKIYSLQL